MIIKEVHKTRKEIARVVFGLILVLLVNGWIDYANHALKPRINTITGQSIAFDDYDTFYEWVAEEMFDLENAQPEQDGDSDDTGKINPSKITLDEHTIDFCISKIIIISSYAPSSKPNRLSGGFLEQWAPPPNV